MIDIADIRGYVALAPKDPGPIAAGLLGWRNALNESICARCAGRYSTRMGMLPLGWHPVWDSTLWPGECDVCGDSGIRGFGD